MHSVPNNTICTANPGHVNTIVSQDWLESWFCCSENNIKSTHKHTHIHAFIFNIMQKAFIFNIMQKEKWQHKCGRTVFGDKDSQLSPILSNQKPTSNILFTYLAKYKTPSIKSGLKQSYKDKTDNDSGCHSQTTINHKSLKSQWRREKQSLSLSIT